MSFLPHLSAQGGKEYEFSHIHSILKIQGHQSGDHPQFFLPLHIWHTWPFSVRRTLTTCGFISLAHHPCNLLETIGKGLCTCQSLKNIILPSTPLIFLVKEINDAHLPELKSVPPLRKLDHSILQIPFHWVFANLIKFFFHTNVWRLTMDKTSFGKS